MRNKRTKNRGHVGRGTGFLLLLSAAVFLLGGCATSPNNADWTGYEAKTAYSPQISDWQTRQQVENAVEETLHRIHDDIDYVDDKEIYGKDYWATAGRIKEAGADDCDGKAVALFHALLWDVGIGEKDVRLMMVHEENAPDAHMVVLWFDGEGTPFLLDPTMDTMIPARDGWNQWKPIVSFDLHHQWTHR